MKRLFLSFILTLNFYLAGAQHIYPYRIFGEVKTVENQVYKGYITWGGNKIFWIDFFEASKIDNPYAHYFTPNAGVNFMVNGNLQSTPSVHNFCCRFGNIRHIRLTGENKIRLSFKNDDAIILKKGNTGDIGLPIEINTPEEKIQLKWEYISEITFMQADRPSVLTDSSSLFGTVKSPQGLYKGLISWNTSGRKNTEKIENINKLLNKMQKVVRDRSFLKAVPLPGSFQHFQVINTNILYPVSNIQVNMPNNGSATIPWDKFQELTVIESGSMKLLNYEDFTIPQKIKGEVITLNNDKICGTLAYDLDENMDFEVLDGKNDNIAYRIPFKYIRSIEPKNYKYSFITLKNGNKLSLGDTCDVNQDNNGIIVFSEDNIPVYVPWSEIKIITLW